MPELTSANRYFLLHKPINMVSQFISPHQVRLLGDLDFPFPSGTHALGRLDSNSEGLLLLTTNKKITRLLFSGPTPHRRTYLVQVNGKLSAENLEKLRSGVSIRISGCTYYTTPPCDVAIVPHPEKEFSFIQSTEQYGEHTWITISLFEGKFRQVRKMIASIHHRCKRLIRISIEDIHLGKMQPGEVVEISETDFFKKLKLD